MRDMTDDERKEANWHLTKAAMEALESTCERSRCGSVIVKGGEIIGKGYNSPPNNDESQRRCSVPKSEYHERVTDKTCCVHAEQRAIMDALLRNPDKLAGSRLYFIRCDKDEEESFAGAPYCTICSKMALDAGIAEIVLWRKEGLFVYGAREYNDYSFWYKD